MFYNKGETLTLNSKREWGCYGFPGALGDARDKDDWSR